MLPVAQLLALALLAPPVVDPQMIIELQGWTRDGTAIVWVIVPGGGDEGVDPMRLSYVTDADGRFLHLFRESRAAGDEYHDEAEAMWKSAEPREAGQRWLAQHPLSGKRVIEWTGVKRQVAGGKEKLLVVVSPEAQRCPALDLKVEWGSSSGQLATDPCGRMETPSEQPGKFESSCRLAWSPDGTRAAIEWNVMRGVYQDFETIWRHHMVVLAPGKLGRP